MNRPLGRQPNQLRAADPATSAWVTANAGTGKTRVLVDRVLRLLLAGTAPSRILCLTFTKAAAAEMSNRIFEILGQWVTRDGDATVVALPPGYYGSEPLFVPATNPKAEDGVAGVRIASTPAAKARSKSRLIRARTRRARL